MFVDRKFKILLLIFLLIIFISISYYSTINSNYRKAKEVLKRDISIEELKKSLKEDAKLDIELKINNNQTYYHAVEDAYFYCIDVKDANSYKKLNLKICSKEKYKYVIDNDKYDAEKGFFIDFNKVNCKVPEIVSPATENIDEMLNIINELVAKGYAYESQGDVYFEVEKFKKYVKRKNYDRNNTNENNQNEHKI